MLKKKTGAAIACTIIAIGVVRAILGNLPGGIITAICGICLLLGWALTED